MRLGVIGLLIGCLLLAALLAYMGVGGIGREVLQAVWALPPIVALHAGQLALSAIAWRAALGSGRFLDVFRIRWIREAVNSLLPVAQIGGPVVGVRLLGQAGIPLARAGAATTLDLMLEACGQLIFTAIALLTLAALSADFGWVAWVRDGVIGAVVALAAFMLAQRAGGLRLIEAAAARLQRRFPTLRLDGLRGMHADLLRLQAQPRVVALALSCHAAAWIMGAAEAWIVLTVMDQSVTPAQALVVEALGMMARSAAFAVPGGVGVQEGGFVLAAHLFGLPADAGIALSMVKRLRELIVAIPGVATWATVDRARAVNKHGNITTL